jgi:superfamily II DNA or RNA helicase
MNENLAPLYGLIKERMDRYIFKDILGDTVADGIESFYSLKKSLSGDAEIDYGNLIIECLGSEILDRKAFVNFILLQGFSNFQIEGVSDILNIDSSLSEFKKRKAITDASKSKIKNAIIEFLELEEAFFIVEKAPKLITREIISPFTPVPVDKENYKELIPKEFLSVHEYQKRIKDKLIKEIIFKPDAKALVHMPTGSGKTKTSVEAIIDFIKIKLTYPHDPGTILWFAHSKELCEQAYSTFKSLWSFKGDYPITAYKVFGDSDYNEVQKCTKDHASIIFIGFQKFDSLLKSKSENLELHSIKQYLKEKTKLVVIDEAHKALAKTYKKALDFVTQTNGCRLVGLTATPGRSNYITGNNENKELAQYFGNNIIRITKADDSTLQNPLKFLQDINVLAQIESEELPVTIDFTKHNYKSNDYQRIENKDDLSSKELDIISTDPHRNAIILDKINENKDLSTLVFAASKDHCLILSRLLKSAHGVDSVVILGETNAKIRMQAIDDFKKGKLKVLINYGVLSTGFDAPRLNTLIVARPTKSIVLYSQIVGRALRGEANGGNKKNKLITIKDNLIGFPNPDFMFSYWEEFWN